jgi:ribosomal protein S19E (S16A)
MAHVQEGPMSTAQSNALVVALIYERAGEPTFRGSRGVNSRTLDVLVRRGLVERDEHNGYRLTEAGRAFAGSLKGELTS